MKKSKLSIICMILFLFVHCGFSKKNTSPLAENVTTIIADSVKHEVLKYDSLQLKYAMRLSIKPNDIKNVPLYRFIENWMSTPYKWGGTDKNGIDCSAFIQKLLADVYKTYIPRTSVEQFFTQNIEPFRGKQFLSEGDLIFFKTVPNTIVSHVGLYLHNNMFVNSASSKGVSIESLDDPYWQSRYVCSGRIRRQFQVTNAKY